MQKRSRLAVLFTAVIAIVLMLAGCSSGSSSSNEPLPDAAPLLQDANKSTRDLKSVHLELVTTGEVKGLPIEKMSGDLTSDPVAAQGKANIVYFGQKVDDVEFVVFDGILYGALTPGTFADFGAAKNVYDVAAILNPDVGLANVLANFSDPKSDGREDIGGATTVKVTGQVSADAVNKIAPSIKAEGPVPGTAWIREDGAHDLVQVKLDITPDSSVSMTLSKWNDPVTIDKPAV